MVSSRDRNAQQMEIWLQIRKDMERGAERLVAEYGNRIYAAAMLLSANEQDAEELTFRTFDQAVKKIRLYNPRWSFLTWLNSIMLNFHRMSLRRRRIDVVQLESMEDLPELSCDAFGELLSTTANDEVAIAVRSLSPALKEVVLLHYFADRPIEEIGEVLGIPVGTVKSRLHNARTELFRRLSGTKQRKGERHD